MKLRSKPLDVGEKAPDFTLPDQDGNDLRLYELLEGGPLVLFFYPKAFTSVCTAEACGFRDSHEQFVDAGARVVGISADDVATQKKFHDKHQLTFPVLSDPKTKVYGLFGLRASSKATLANDRVTFVIDGDGIVRHHSSGMLVSEPHIRESLAAVQQLD